MNKEEYGDEEWLGCGEVIKKTLDLGVIRMCVEKAEGMRKREGRERKERTHGAYTQMISNTLVSFFFLLSFPSAFQPFCPFPS